MLFDTMLCVCVCVADDSFWRCIEVCCEICRCGVCVCVCVCSFCYRCICSQLDNIFYLFCYGDIMRKAVQGPVQAAWRCMGKVQIEAELDACYLQLS